MSDERPNNNPYQENEPDELSLGEALREIAQRTSFATEDTQRKVLAAIDKSIGDDNERREREQAEREQAEREQAEDDAREAARDDARVGDDSSPAANNGPGTGTDATVTGSGAEVKTTPKTARAGRTAR